MSRLVGRAGRLERIQFKQGRPLARTALFKELIRLGLPPGPRLDLLEVATRADGGCGEGLGWQLNQARVTMMLTGDEVITGPS